MCQRSVLFVATAICVALGTGVYGSSDSRTANDKKRNAKPSITTSSRLTSVRGTAWDADNSPVKEAHVRLRNVLTGRVEGSAIANDAGQFTFDNVEEGTYIVELVTDNGRILTVGHPFTIAAGETVATFVRLGTKIPWFRAFFSNAAAAATATAASQGIAAIAPVARPASVGR